MQRGASGVMKGIPDLLIHHEALPFILLGIEVKKPGRPVWTSTEQRANYEKQVFHLAQSEVEALTQAHNWLANALGPDHAAVDRSRRTLTSLLGTDAHAGHRQST
jgi:hypothetical protein